MKQSHEQKARRIATLLAGHMRNTNTPAEEDELDEWVGASDKNMRLFEELTDPVKIKLALELLNDHHAGLLTRLRDDRGFKFVSIRSKWNIFLSTSAYILFILGSIIIAYRSGVIVSFIAGALFAVILLVAAKKLGAYYYTEDK